MKTTLETPNRCEISGILKLGGKKGGIYMGVSENSGTPKSSISNRVFHYKPSILGYLYFWKHPHIPPVMVMMVIFVSQVMDQESKNHSRLKQMSCSHESGKFAPRAIGYEYNFVIARLVSNFVYGGITLPLQLLLIGPSHTWLLDSELSCTILEISEE